MSTSERIEPKVVERQARFELLGRSIAGALALVCLVSAAVQLATPLNGDWVRLVLVPLAALLASVAATDEGSRATFLMYKATVATFVAAFLATDVLPPLMHLSTAYLAVAAALAACGFAALAKRPLVGWRWLLAGSVAASLALPLLSEQLGAVHPPLPGYLLAELYTCEPLLVAGMAGRVLLTPRRLRSA